MQCLVEVHDESELETAIDKGAEVIGINNRDLHTFTTDLAVTQRLAPLVPDGKVLVSESGIFTADDLRLLEGPVSAPCWSARPWSPPPTSPPRCGSSPDSANPRSPLSLWGRVRVRRSQA